MYLPESEYKAQPYRARGRRRGELSRRGCYALSVMLGFVFMTLLLSLSGPAWSVGNPAGEILTGASSHPPSAIRAAGTDASLTGNKILSATEPDQCHSLLHNTGKEAGLVSDNNRHASAGQVAALSLVLGVRYAVGPADTPHVHAVTAYRACKKQHALKAMSQMAPL